MATNSRLGSLIADQPVAGDRPRVRRACPMCGRDDLRVCFTYDRLMPLEASFDFTRADGYWREIHRCSGCGHFYEWHELKICQLYTEDYVSKTYGDRSGIRAAFDRILMLPAEQSDNDGRIRRVSEFSQRRFEHLPSVGSGRRLLDVGSGLCVFAARMKSLGWNCTVLDLDPRLVEHAREAVGVTAILGSLGDAPALGAFEAVTFNKVLEHVPDPIELLSAAQSVLEPAGFVYVEVPDGEVAVNGGRERQEFLLGHIHVFSAASLALLMSRSGFRVLDLQRLHEPSGKNTLYAFACVNS